MINYLVQDDLLYACNYFAESATMFIAILVVASNDIIFIGLCVTVTVQFRVIRQFLENTNFSESNGGENIQETLRKFVNHHNVLLE